MAWGEGRSVSTLRTRATIFNTSSVAPRSLARTKRVTCNVVCRLDKIRSGPRTTTDKREINLFAVVAEKNNRRS